MQRRTAIKNSAQYAPFLVIIILTAVSAAVLLSADVLFRPSGKIRHEKNAAEIIASKELRQELDNTLNRIDYVRRQEDSAIRTSLSNQAEAAVKFITKMTELHGKNEGLASAVRILSALNREDSRYRLYVLGLDGKAYLFPADHNYENASFLGFGNKDGENIFADMTASPAEYEKKFVSYTLTSEENRVQAGKISRFTSDPETGIAVIAEADRTEIENLIKKKVTEDLTRLFMLYPAYGRINIFESVTVSGGGKVLLTLLNEELENTHEKNKEKSDEFAPHIFAGKDEILHTRKDPVFGKHSEVLTLTAAYPDWNWHITKSHFFQYENPNSVIDTKELITKGSYTPGIVFISSVLGLMSLFTVLFLIGNSMVSASALKPEEKRIGRLRRVNFRLTEKIKKHTEKGKKIEAEKQQLEEKLALKTKDYKKMNEMLIAENMERTQQDQILRAEKEKAETANIMKREFLTNTSERLKTMVTEIRNLSEKGADNFEQMTAEEVSELFGHIHTKGGELMSFLGLLIDLSKLEAGKTEDKILPLDIKELFARLSYETIPLFASKGNRLNVDFASENIKIFTRSRHAELAFLHLITFAAKNCGQGISLSLRYFHTKSLRAGMLVDAVTVELRYIPTVSGLRGHSTFTLPSGSDSASINISIFNEALKRCGGTFFLTETAQGSVFSAVIPDLGDQQ
ncbi:MAG: cache domain-containing protein [Deferribacterales bacterium]